MELRTNPEYSERLASFFVSLGQRAVVAGPGRVEVMLPQGEIAKREMAIYLRVWGVMYPDAKVTVESES
jgi:hypothetical protein